MHPRQQKEGFNSEGTYRGASERHNSTAKPKEPTCHLKRFSSVCRTQCQRMFDKRRHHNRKRVNLHADFHINKKAYTISVHTTLLNFQRLPGEVETIEILQQRTKSVWVYIRNLRVMLSFFFKEHDAFIAFTL